MLGFGPFFFKCKICIYFMGLPWKEEQWLGCEGESVDDRTLEEMCADGGIAAMGYYVYKQNKNIKN